MANRLLHRQIKLLEYLTSFAAIYGHAKTDSGSDLIGIPPALLRLEARFSHEKRMAKITAVFPRTFALLGAHSDATVRAFVEACPADHIDRITNARQFHNFLCVASKKHRRHPAYLTDVSACELALAELLAGTEAGAAASARTPRRRGWIRRPTEAALLRLSHDVRPLFEAGPTGSVCPVARDTPVVIVRPARDREPQIFELPPVVFELLAALNTWSDPSVLGATAHAKALMTSLVENGLLEVAP
ncbi:MAG: hypothetical protein ACJ8F3_11035 [Xanthobacteraceae bacterium]